MFFIICFLNSDGCHACPIGYTVLSSGKCVLISNESANYLKAAIQCRKIGGILFEPMNDQESEEVKQMMPNDRYWIGIDDLTMEGK